MLSQKAKPYGLPATIPHPPTVTYTTPRVLTQPHSRLRTVSTAPRVSFATVTIYNIYLCQAPF